MNKITQFDKTQLTLLRRELSTVLTQLGDNFGIALGAHNITYEPNSCTIQLKASIKGKLTRSQQQISVQASLLGLDNIKHLSKLRSASRGALTLVDYKSRSPKYPWICELANGNRIKVTDAGLTQMAGVR